MAMTQTDLPVSWSGTSTQILSHDYNTNLEKFNVWYQTSSSFRLELPFFFQTIVLG